MSNMTVQIDDSGYGALVGGLMIGLYRVDTNTTWCEYISEVAFQRPLRSRKGWKVIHDRIMEYVKLGLKELGVTKVTHTLEICQGWILDETSNVLSKEGWAITRVKITGKLQRFVESMFRRELAKIDMELASYSTPGSTSFFKMLDWVSVDLDNRERYVKTGWHSWEKKWKPRIRLKQKHL